jgi:catechol 2,3-dioxygenase-like lactoylglutathione lyase family enzyme
MKNFLLTAFVVSMCSTAFSQHQPASKIKSMKEVDQLYTVFITTKLDKTVRFYETYFGFTKLFESTFFVLLQTPEQKFTIAFMDEQHPTAPPTPKSSNGNGSFLTIEVANAKEVYEKIKERGLVVSYELKDEVWGQRRFGVLDPNNLWVDVVQQIAPAEGYWEKYMKN